MKISPSRSRPILFCSLLLLAPWLCAATSRTLEPEFQVNTYTTDWQQLPAVAEDGAGNFVVVWTSFLQDGSQDGIFGQRYDRFGTPLGGEFQVNSYTTDLQREPAVSADDAGNFVVVWFSSDNQDGTSAGIFGRRFDSAGNPVGTDFQVNTYTTGTQADPAVAADSAGNFMVVWESEGQDGSSRGVYGQRFEAAGLPDEGEFRINTYTTGNQQDPAVAADPSGDFVVVWTGSGVQDGSLAGVFGQRFDSAGDAEGSEFQVNTYTTLDQFAPRLDTDGFGNFVVVWRSYQQDHSSTGVFAQRFDSTNQPLGSELPVNTYTAGIQWYPDVASDDAGNFVIVWASAQGQDGSASGIFGQRYDASGAPREGEFPVNSFTTGYQLLPAVAGDGSGNFLLVWGSTEFCDVEPCETQDGSGGGIFGRLLTNTLFIGDFESGDVCAWSSAQGSDDNCA